MSKRTSTYRCGYCSQARLKFHELRQQNQELMAKNARLQGQVALLGRRLALEKKASRSPSPPRFE